MRLRQQASGVQISFADFTYDRDGNLDPAPDWMRSDRCETCRWWEILPVEDQPPAGWGVKGQCNCTHEAFMMTKGYWKTGKTSYCCDYAARWEG